MCIWSYVGNPTLIFFCNFLFVYFTCRCVGTVCADGVVLAVISAESTMLAPLTKEIKRRLK